MTVLFTYFGSKLFSFESITEYFTNLIILLNEYYGTGQVFSLEDIMVALDYKACYAHTQQLAREKEAHLLSDRAARHYTHTHPRGTTRTEEEASRNGGRN